MKVGANLSNSLLLTLLVTITLSIRFVSNESTSYYEAIDKVCSKNAESYTISTDLTKAAKERKYAYDRCAQRVAVFLLANAWSRNSVLECDGMHPMYEKFVENFEKENIFNIYAKTLDDIYNTEKAELLAGHIQRTYLKGNLKSLEVTVESQLYLFWKYFNRHDLNEKYLYFVAYYIDQLRKDELIGRLVPSLRTRLDMVIAELPSSLRHFIFNPNFCLLNKKYNYFMYTTLPNDFEEGHIKHIFTWESSSNVESAGVFLKEEVKKNHKTLKASQDDLKYILRGQDLRYPVYIEKEYPNWHNLVAAWKEGGSVPPNQEWSVELTGNELVFSQHNVKMCSSIKSHDTERRFVYALGKEVSDTDCQWIVRDCY